MVSILIIDDHADSTEALARLLRLCGHTVATSASGESALKILDAITPDVILVDVIMPGMSGPELAGQLRQRGSAPRIIGMSGVAEHDSTCFPACFDHFLRKPIKLDELRAVLETGPSGDGQRGGAATATVARGRSDAAGA